MTAPIALQLYTVRDALAQDFAGTMKQIAEIGYVGVETAGFPGNMFPDTTPAAAGKLFRNLGLKVPSAHAPLPLGDQKTAVLDAMAALACTHLVSPWMNPDFYASEDGIKRLARTFNEANVVCADNGLKLSIHNHWFEMEKVNGRPAYQILMEYLDTAVLFQVDTYWVKAAGLDPAEVVGGLGARAPLLHIKDGPATREADMTAVGDGVMDVPGIIAAGEGHTEWQIVELDRCTTDMMAAVAKSYSYLTSAGLAYGNKDSFKNNFPVSRLGD